MDIRITPSRLRGTLLPVDSKSHAHRLLIAAFLSEVCERERLSADCEGGRLSADCEGALKLSDTNKDIEATKACLRALSSESVPRLNCGESGSTLRFLLPLASVLAGEAYFSGEGRLPKRPLEPLLSRMKEHGVSAEICEPEGPSAPFLHIKGRLESGIFELPGNVSSQYITGLLFALPLLSGDSEIRIKGPLESAGYVDMTLAVLNDFGIKVDMFKDSEIKDDALKAFGVKDDTHNDSEIKDDTLKAFGVKDDALNDTEIKVDALNDSGIKTAALGSAASEGDGEENGEQSGGEVSRVYRIAGGQSYAAPSVQPSIEADWSSAAFWIAANALGAGNDVKLAEGGDRAALKPDSCQPDREIVRLASLLEGARCSEEALEIDVSQIPDLLPILSVLAASRRKGRTDFVNAARLRIKESDRLEAAEEMIKALGGRAVVRADSLTVYGSDAPAAKPLSDCPDEELDSPDEKPDSPDADPLSDISDIPDIPDAPAAKPLSGGLVDGKNDHRIVMAAAVASTICRGSVSIKGAEAAAKSYPRFWEDFRTLGGDYVEI